MNADIPLVYPKYKYVSLILFLLISACSGMQWTTYMPITEYTCKILNASHMQIYILGLTYMFFYPVGGFIGNYLHDRKGLKFGTLAGGILTVVGGGIRCLSFKGYYPLLIGQSISAIAQPFLNNANSKIINEWFEPKYRAFYIALTACSTLLGNCFGFLIPPPFVNKDNITMRALTLLNVVEACISLGVCIPLLIFFKNSPYAPQNKSSGCNFKQYGKCLTNKWFLIITFSSALPVGTFGSFSTVIESLLLPFGFTSKDASTLGFVLIFGGSAEAMLLSWISDRTKKYKMLYLISVSLSSVIFVVMYFIFASRSFVLLNVAIILVGPGLVYLTPAAMDYLARITPDIDESVSTGIVQDLVQIITIAQTTGCDYIQKNYNNKLYVAIAIIIFGLCNIIGMILGIFLKPLPNDTSPSFRKSAQKKNEISPRKMSFSKKVMDDTSKDSATSINKTKDVVDEKHP